MLIARPIIIEGLPFDWDAGGQAAANAVGDDGEINWGCAFSADPGVVSCPCCGQKHWREGTIVECWRCGKRWRVEPDLNLKKAAHRILGLKSDYDEHVRRRWGI